jgi:two-component sensor histidine kinase
MVNPLSFALYALLFARGGEMKICFYRKIRREEPRTRGSGADWLFLGCATSALVAALGLAGCSAPAPKISQPRGGILDLRSIDFNDGASVPLTGLWDFLPGPVDIPSEKFLETRPELRKVPDLWNGDEAGGSRGHGSGTYHLTVLLPSNAPPLALHYTSASTAFRIDVQGKRVAQVGFPSSDPKAAIAAYRPGFVAIEPIRDRMDITVGVSNYVYRSGGLWFPIFLGPAAAIEAEHQNEFAATLVQSTSLAAMSLFLLLIFYLRKKDRALLFSGLMALLLALRIMVTGEYIVTRFWPQIPFELMIKLEYLTVSLPFPAATMFFACIFPKLLDRRVKWACILPSLAYTLLVIILPLDPLTRSLIFYQAFAFVNIVVIVGAVFFKTVMKLDAEGVALFIGTVLLALSVINDLLYSSFIWWTGNLAPWGFGAFVAFQVVILVKRLTTAFAEAEELLDQKELMIKEIHHRVKNNLQVVASLLSLQSHRVNDPESKDVFSSLRLRIVSMSLVHEKLYGKVAAESLDLGDYLQDLIGLLISKDKTDAGKVNLTIRPQAIRIGVDACVDAGLIVTELVSNAIKYAFLPKGGGNLSVEMSRDGEMAAILIADDGPGFPPNFDPGATKSLGYKLIISLLRTHQGKLEILPGPGGRVRVSLFVKRS